MEMPPGTVVAVGDTAGVDAVDVASESGAACGKPALGPLAQEAQTAAASMMVNQRVGMFSTVP